METITKQDFIYALEIIRNWEKILYLNKPSEEKMQKLRYELLQNPMGITDFIDFHKDSPAEKKEKTKLYLKTVFGKDFDVEFFILDPRINIIRCYGKIIGADINILSKNNNVKRIDSKHYVITGEYPNLQIKLISDEKDKIKDNADIIFSIVNANGCKF